MIPALYHEVDSVFDEAIPGRTEDAQSSRSSHRYLDHIEHLRATFLKRSNPGVQYVRHLYLIVAETGTLLKEQPEPPELARLILTVFISLLPVDCLRTFRYVILHGFSNRILTERNSTNIVPYDIQRSLRLLSRRQRKLEYLAMDHVLADDLLRCEADSTKAWAMPSLTGLACVAYGNVDIYSEHLLGHLYCEALSHLQTLHLEFGRFDVVGSTSPTQEERSLATAKYFEQFLCPPQTNQRLNNLRKSSAVSKTSLNNVTSLNLDLAWVGEQAVSVLTQLFNFTTLTSLKLSDCQHISPPLRSLSCTGNLQLHLVPQ